jgi:mono/diheme cytochrome c family protein
VDVSVLAETNTTGILLVGLGALAIGLSIVAFALRNRARGKRAEVPNAIRPGPADAALETPLLNRLQGWGVVLVTFFVIWFPLQWLFEPSRNFAQESDLRVLAEQRGERAVYPYSEENQLGVGCTRCHGAELKGGVIPYTDPATGVPGYGYPANLTTICAGVLDPAGGHSSIYSVNDIYKVIQQGRGDMPSWSIRYAGALTDQQINDIVTYLIALSSQHVAYEDNICINPDAQAKALKLAAQNGVSESA